MILLYFFDYIYYQIAIIYDKWFDYGHIKEGSAIMVLSILQFSSLLSLDKVISKSYFSNGYFFVITPIILLILNYIRYFKIINYKNLEEKWKNDSKYLKSIKTIIVVIYVVFSIYFIGYKP